jgi:hypothetical protein
MTEKKKYPIYHKDPPSHDFESAFPGGGGPATQCTCGRTHVAIDSENLEEGQREWYLQRHEEDYEGYILVYNCDYVMHSELNGNVFMDDCPCHGMRHYENLFWNSRKQFRTYLAMVKLRKAAELEDVGEWSEDL